MGRFRTIVLAGASLLALGPATRSALAQFPRARPGQFEVRGFDFRADGAWRRRTNAVRAIRHALLRAGAVGALNSRSAAAPGAARVTGHYFVPVLPIAFRNVTIPFPVTDYENLFFSGAPVARPYSVKTFYEQLSNNNIQMDGTVFQPVTVDSADRFYEDGCNGIPVNNPCGHPIAADPQAPSIRFAQLIIQALTITSSGPDAATRWAQFDNDGPDGIPNSGDDDGIVDFITFLQPELDGACGVGSNIWAHRFVVSALNGGSPFVTRTPSARGRFITIEDYTIQSAVGGGALGNHACGDGTGRAPGIMPIGTVAHETGHAFGLPDLYDTKGRTEGIGEWGLMGSGNYARPHSPARYEAWSLAELGWVTVDTLGASRTVRARPVSLSDTVYYAGVPGTSEYFLLENRQPLGSDSAQMDPSFIRAKAPGLLVWHIDGDQVAAYGFGVDGAGGNSVNAGPIHGVALVQADGRGDLERPDGMNRGDTGDPFPGATANRRLSSTTRPQLRDNAGRATGFLLDSVYQVAPGGDVVFRFLRGANTVVQGDHAGALIRVDGMVTTRFEDIVAPGASIVVGVDTLQAPPGGASRLHFTAWSDGGTATHTVVVAAADTLIARFDADYRVVVQIDGAAPGAVTASAAGDVAAGIYLREGTPVTLTAAAPAGLAFAGWTGDTLSKAPVLTLPMAHAYVVSARFATAVPVTLRQAVDGLIGVAPLAAPQTTYLDSTGNGNGVYDLGDFLAFVTRTGQMVSAATMARMLTRPVRHAAERR